MRRTYWLLRVRLWQRSDVKAYHNLYGVTQGYSLGPLLFSLYMFPLCDIIRKGHVQFETKTTQCGNKAAEGSKLWGVANSKSSDCNYLLVLIYIFIWKHYKSEHFFPRGHSLPNLNNTAVLYSTNSYFTSRLTGTLIYRHPFDLISSRQHITDIFHCWHC